MAFFTMHCHHHPDKDEARDAVRPTHREWVKSGGNGLASVLIGSAFLHDDGSPAGHWGILETDSRENAQSFAEGDPFNKNGIVERIQITALPDGFQAHRITERMSG